MSAEEKEAELKKKRRNQRKRQKREDRENTLLQEEELTHKYGATDFAFLEAMSSDESIYDSDPDAPQKGLLSLLGCRSREAEDAWRTNDRIRRAKGKTSGRQSRVLKHPHMAYLPPEGCPIPPLSGKFYRWMVSKSFADRLPSAVKHVRLNQVTEASVAAGIVIHPEQWGKEPPFELVELSEEQFMGSMPTISPSSG